MTSMDTTTPSELSPSERQVLERAVRRLPPKCKMALILVRLEGKSYEEAAKQLGTDTATCIQLIEAAMVFLLTVSSTTKRKPQSDR